MSSVSDKENNGESAIVKSYVRKKKPRRKKGSSKSRNRSAKTKKEQPEKAQPIFVMEKKLNNTRQGDYQIMEDIGKGGFGTVYRGLHLISGATVAIKSVSLAGVGKEDLENIEMEITLMKNLEHDNICKYIDSIRSKDHLLIIIEFVENGAISGLISKFDNQVPETLCKVYTAQVLKGLHYLHSQGVIHRDIKGANILTTKEGTVKLADFGVAARLGDKSAGAEEVVGTPYWMAPEIIEMKSDHSVACDIWSVGCTVIELLTGKPPYFDLPQMPAMFRIVQDDHPPLPDPISSALEDFLLQCFQKDPTRRIDALGLLKHPWLKDVVTDDEETKTPSQLTAAVAADVKQVAVTAVTTATTTTTTTAATATTAADADEGSDLDWDAEILDEENTVPVVPPTPTLGWGGDDDAEDSDDDPFAGMSDSDSDNTAPAVITAASQQPKAKAQSKAQLLKRFAEADSDDDDSGFGLFDDDAIDDDVFASLERHTATTTDLPDGVTSQEEEEADPFLEIDFFDTNDDAFVPNPEDLRLKKALQKAIMQLDPAESDTMLLQACESLQDILNNNDQDKVCKAIREHKGVVIPFMDVLELDSAPVLLAALRVLNLMISYNDKGFQQSLSVVGLVPAIIKFAGPSYISDIRLEAANFIRLFCSSSDFSRKMFVACGGLPALVGFLDADYNAGDSALIYAAVDCINYVFKITTNPKNDFCRLFCKSGLLEPLAQQLLALNSESGESKEYAKRVGDLFHLFSQSGDAIVKVNFSQPEVIELLIKVLPVCDDDLQLILLKSIRNIAMESRTRQHLQSAAVIPALVPFLNEQQPVASLSQVLATMYDMCRLSPGRQQAAAQAGIIPHLKRIVHSDLPIKQFAFSTIFLLSKTQKAQVELVKHGGVQLFVNLLDNQYWSIPALKSIADWVHDDPVRVGFLLSSTKNISKLVHLFIDTRTPNHFIEVIGSFHRMVSDSPQLLETLGNNQMFVHEIVNRFRIHSAVNKLKIDLLKCLKLILDSNRFRAQFVVEYKITQLLKQLAGDNSVTMAAALAQQMLNNL